MATTPVLRKLITFVDGNDEQVPCSYISVRGDATYCIDGPVCSGFSDQVSGACPSKGDAAIGHCIQTSRSFTTGCVAPVDAHCVIGTAGHWECVFPDSNTNASSDAASATETEATPTPTQVASQESLSAPSPSDSSGLALSATTQDTNAASASELEKMVQAPNAALNVIVGASCCILALVGLAFVKKRRGGGRSSSSTLSSSNSSILTL